MTISAQISSSNSSSHVPPKYIPDDLATFNYLRLPKHAFVYAIPSPRRAALQLENTSLSFKIQINCNVFQKDQPRIIYLLTAKPKLSAAFWGFHGPYDFILHTSYQVLRRIELWFNIFIFLVHSTECLVHRIC